jgi:hypothetical protein
MVAESTRMLMALDLVPGVHPFREFVLHGLRSLLCRKGFRSGELVRGAEPVEGAHAVIGVSHRSSPHWIHIHLRGIATFNSVCVRYLVVGFHSGGWTRPAGPSRITP